MYFFNKIFMPEIYQGKNKRKNYFEGWYFKLIDKTAGNTFAIIPGVSFPQKKEDAHAFIQVIDARTYKTYYFKFDISAFSFSKVDFHIKIGENSFCNHEMTINLKNEEMEINGTLHFREIVPFPKTLLKPSIMGPFYFVPFMECFHQVINIHHKIEGSLIVGDSEINFDGGSGYLEKDYGVSFPEAWIWLQSNHFENKQASLMFSVAKIPFVHKFFNGFISFLRIEDKIYLFSTYSGAKITCLEVDENIIKIVVKDKRNTLTIHGEYKQSGVLISPRNGLMNRKMDESISSLLKVVLLGDKERVIFEGHGENVGMEIVGEL